MTVTRAKNLGVILNFSSHTPYSVHQYVFHSLHQYILIVLSSKYTWIWPLITHKLCPAWPGLHYCFALFLNLIAYYFFHHSLYQLYRLPCCSSNKLNVFPIYGFCIFWTIYLGAFPPQNICIVNSLTYLAFLLKSHQLSSVRCSTAMPSNTSNSLWHVTFPFPAIFYPWQVSISNMLCTFWAYVWFTL